MIDAKKFSREIYEEFLEAHPAQKAEGSELAKLVLIMADVCATAIAKYDRENSR